MAKINDYYQKKQLMEQLANELDQLEQDQALKGDLKFENKVRDLMTEFNKEARDVLPILAAIDPSLQGAVDGVTGKRAKRALITYKNPHTGEVVRTRGGNHKTLKRWRDEHGKDTVLSWQTSD